MYDEKAKERSIRYLKDKREKLTLNLPLGSKERYKSHAERKGKSLTGLIIELIEKDIERGVKNNAIEEKIDELNQNIQLSKNNNGLILGDTVHSHHLHDDTEDNLLIPYNQHLDD